MTGYIIRRLGQSVIVLIGVTLITFIMLHALPGSLARDILGNRATPQSIALFNHQNGLDKPVYVQYWDFLDQLLHGNLGFSYQYNRSTDSLLATDLPRDLVLGGVVADPLADDRDPARDRAGGPAQRHHRLRRHDGELPALLDAVRTRSRCC